MAGQDLKEPAVKTVLAILLLGCLPVKDEARGKERGAVHVSAYDPYRPAVVSDRAVFNWQAGNLVFIAQLR
jgi:hypothetical protein